MPNYTNLKAAVTDAIKANGNQEITGQVLQSNLLSIIENFAANRTFAGVATPTTAPPTVTDGNVFYVAFKKGTYTNFGSLVNPADGLIFLINTSTGTWQIVDSGFDAYANVGVFNVSEYNNKYDYTDDAAAIAAVPEKVRKLGAVVRFKTAAGWRTLEYVGSDMLSATWVDSANWKDRDAAVNFKVDASNLAESSLTNVQKLAEIADRTNSKLNNVSLVYFNNLFSTSDLTLINKLLRSNGTITDQNGGVVSAIMPCSYMDVIIVKQTGVTSTGANRVVWLLDSAGNYLTYTALVGQKTRDVFVVNHHNAKYFRLVLKVKTSDTIDVSSYIVSTSEDSSSSREVYVDTSIHAESLNEFSAAKAIKDVAVWGDGDAIQKQTDGNYSYISRLIRVSGWSSVYVSGLPIATNSRSYAFLDKDRTVLSRGYYAGSVTSYSLSVPSGASYFVMSPMRNEVSMLNMSNIKISEYGTESDFYSPSISSVLGIPIKNTTVKYGPIGRNLFNNNAISIGSYVSTSGNGVVYTDGGVDYATYTFKCKSMRWYTISGLSIPRYSNYISIKDAAGSVINWSQKIIKTYSFGAFFCPINADTVTITIKSGASDIPDYNKIVICEGGHIIDYEPYKSGIITLDGIPVVSDITKHWYGKKWLLFGDSITTEASALNGDGTYTVNMRNYTTHLKAMMQSANWVNFAQSGAGWCSRDTLTTYQKLENQIQLALYNSVHADYILINLATNDMNARVSIGDYTTAMGKSVDVLDKLVFYEAMRWALHTLQNAYPSANIIVCTPLQVASEDASARTSYYDAMAKMAQRYGAILIDQRCLIVRDFETVGANGRYLSDGLHPNEVGMYYQATKLYTAITQNI